MSKKDVVNAVGSSSKTSATGFNLQQNCPNPFNPLTHILFSLPVASIVDLRVFDMLGQEVAILVHDWKEEGNHQVEFDASVLSSGVYFYQLRSGEFSSIKKMILVR